MPDSLPLAELVHAMPGRARLRIAEKRGDAAFFSAIALRISALPGVLQVDARPLTGSIVIEHGPPIAQIAARAAEARLFTLVETPTEEPAAWPAPPIEPRLAAAGVLGLIAVWQLLRGRLFPPALTAAWYAAHLAGFSTAAEHADEAE